MIEPIPCKCGAIPIVKKGISGRYFSCTCYDCVIGTEAFLTYPKLGLTDDMAKEKAINAWNDGRVFKCEIVELPKDFKP